MFQPPSTAGRGKLFLAATWILVWGAALSLLDLPLAEWCLADSNPKFVRKILQLSEVFGHGLGVLWIFAAVYALDAQRRLSLPRIIYCTLAAALAADVVKMLVVRIRPRHFDFSGEASSTFQGWLPLWTAGSMGQSFPSAHTATAFGLAVSLIHFYRRGRWFFLMLGTMVAMQRVDTGAHYLSDVILGASLGWAVSTWILNRTEASNIAGTAKPAQERTPATMRRAA